MVLAKSGLSGEALRVHAVVMGTIGWANVVTVTQAEIARQLGITPQAVNRSWRALLGADLVRRLKRTDEHGIERELWIASPYVSWRGDSRKHALAMREWDAVQERSS